MLKSCAHKDPAGNATWTDGQRGLSTLHLSTQIPSGLLIYYTPVSQICKIAQSLTRMLNGLLRMLSVNLTS